MSDFITHLPAPGASISSYDRSKPPSSQPREVPHLFIDAMSIRETVFVHEQGVPLENELDADDARSYHFIVYASVNEKSSGGTVQQGFDVGASSTGKEERRQSGSNTASGHRVAVGTVRLVPPPHPPHPAPGSEHAIDNIEDAPRTNMGGSVEQTLAEEEDVDSNLGEGPNMGQTLKKKLHLGKSHRKADTNPGHPSGNKDNEPYIKLGRLAVLPRFRKMGLARLLLEQCLDWAGKHPTSLVPQLGAVEKEARRSDREARRSMSDSFDHRRSLGGLEGRRSSRAFVEEEDQGEWKGLVLVHAQVQLEGLYKRWGFKTDEGMGRWWEEGIEHVGMWRRVAVSGRR